MCVALCKLLPLEVLNDTPSSSLMDSMRVHDENNKRRNSQGVLLGSWHFRGRRVCWSFEMGTRKIDKQINYSHELGQTKQQVG